MNQAEDALQLSREEKKSTQTELDDLLMVFSDLEEKVEGYKVRTLSMRLPYIHTWQ